MTTNGRSTPSLSAPVSRGIDSGLRLRFVLPLRVPAWVRGGAWLGMCLWLVSPLAALNPERKADSYSIQGWFTEQGLPSNKIRAIAQTRDGYLWLATAQGIARFDGTRFTAFTGATNPELRGGGFFAVLETPDGALWFGGDNGLFLWRNGRFDRFTTEHGLAHNYVRALTLTRDGAMVACTRAGYSFIRGVAIATPGEAWKQVTGVTRSFLERADGTILLGTDDGLWQVSGQAVTQLSGPGGLEGSGFTSLLETDDGTLWIGYNRGVRCVRADGTTMDYGPAEGMDLPRNSDMRFDRDGNLWIAGSSDLYRLTGGRIAPARYPEQLGGTTLQRLYEDREGGLWIATATGLFHLRDNVGSSIGTAEGLARTSAYTVLETHDGAWWIGLWGGGVYRYEQGRATRLDVPAALGLDRALALAEYPAGTLWIGSMNGLYRHTGGETINLYDSEQAEALKEQLANRPDSLLPGIVHNRVNSIAADGEGGLWVATAGALYHGQAGRFRAYTSADGLPGDDFKSVIRASNGDIWITAPPFGVARLREGRWTNYLCGQAISDVYPRAIYEDSGGSIWVTTEGGGINRFIDGRWRIYTARDGLADDYISGLVNDKLGNLWIACPSGVMRIPLAEFEELDAGERTALQPRLFNRFDGLPNGETNQQGSPNATQTRDGRLLFATDSGVAVIEPGNLQFNTLVPPVHIERIVVNGIDADVTQAVTVPPGRNEVEIFYTAISLRAAEKVRFKIQLSPLDNDWVDVRERRNVRYDKLPPGKYEFRVVASNNDGVWNNDGATIRFTVRPFFYQTAWFIGLVIVAVGTGVPGVYWLRARRARRLMVELGKLVDVKTRQLQAEVEERKQAEVRLAESHVQLMIASRKAGMAEVATGVIHNVGNVLNSVNVSAGILRRTLHASEVSTLARVADLLRSRESDIDRFLTADPKGRLLPGLVIQLAEQIEKEHATLRDEQEHLTRNVEHIKSIVAMQQNFANVSGVLEKVRLADLLRDVLQMHTASFVRHGVEVIREYENLPETILDKHKVMQILVNLVANARQAIDEAGRRSGRIHVRLQKAGGERVRISISDDGVGIPAENFTKIFSHGFTTRQDGHGFGLHSGANAAREMGGSLTVESAGAGMGATFVLELPIEANGSNND